MQLKLFKDSSLNLFYKQHMSSKEYIYQSSQGRNIYYYNQTLDLSSTGCNSNITRFKISSYCLPRIFSLFMKNNLA